VDKPLSLEDIRSLLEMLQKHEVTEFKFERGEEKIALKRGPVEEQAAAQQSPHIQQVFGQMQNPSQQVGGFASEASSPHANSQTASSSALGAVQYEQTSMPSEAAPKAAAAPKKAFTEVTSPMVGTFYRRPAVDAEPYVDVGDYVKKGEVLCIVEAMKLMNEIESEYSGKIVEISLEDGQMVEYGETLFKIEVS
jgi:acetyl-CoA carboxylase biotin carboxyl carrier protein